MEKTVSSIFCERERQTLSPYAFLTEIHGAEIIPVLLVPTARIFSGIGTEFFIPRRFVALFIKHRCFCFPWMSTIEPA